MVCVQGKEKFKLKIQTTLNSNLKFRPNKILQQNHNLCSLFETIDGTLGAFVFTRLDMILQSFVKREEPRLEISTFLKAVIFKKCVFVLKSVGALGCDLHLRHKMHYHGFAIHFFKKKLCVSNFSMEE